MSSASPGPIVAVLDTNVVIAALVWNGTPGKLMARTRCCAASKCSGERQKRHLPEQ